MRIIEVGGLNKTASENSNVTLTVTYDTSTGAVKSIVPSGYSKFFSFETGDAGVIKIKNLVEPNYKIKKIDENENALSGVEFKVSYDLWDELDIEKEHETETFTTNSNGEVNILTEEIKQAIMNKFISEGGENPIGFWIDIQEVKTKNGYINIFGSKSIRLMYDGLKLYNAAEYDYSDIADGSYKINEGESCIYIKNKSGIEKLTILKVDSTNPNKKLEGAKFEITLNNISKVNGKEYSEPIIKTVSENGQIVLEKLEIADLSKDITIQIKETEAPKGYKSINGTITIKLKRDGDKYTTHTVTTEGNVLESEVKAGDISVNNHEVQLTIGNSEVIKLSGQVWLDAQEGEKKAANPDGKKDDNEKKVDGVKVHLYSVKDGKIIAETATKTVTKDGTTIEGYYEFSDITKTAEGYKIYFEYNGILYDDVGVTDVGDEKVNSDAAEIDDERKAFNGRFETITQGKSNDGTTLTYNYSDNKSILNSSIDGSTPINSSIKAYTDVYKTTTANIDCGLISKYYDLRVDNLIENVKYTINGKEWTDTPNGDETTYSTNMYVSDYYYRFDDYGVNNIGFKTDDTTERNKLENVGKELEAEVTYRLVLSNQSIHDTKNAKIEYKYDTSKYTFVDDPDNKGTITIDTGEFTTAKEILLTFKLNKNADGYLITGDVDTTAEIISYTTDGGLIDVDSEPGNGKEEDDISYSKLTFEIANEDREISGNVAEANNSEGKLDGEKIDDVIVQLIEIIKVEKDGKTQFYEYIWQETVSGSNQVKYRTKDNKVDTYTNSLAGNDSSKGQYEFLGYSNYASDSTGNELERHTGFIPGDYIVRFIYGDGTTYDLNSNVEKYNGQDYKSTIDKSYTSEWYTAGNYSENSSTARDNEARRLEVMAFSTEIDGGLGVALNTLNKDFSQFTEKEKTLLKGFYEDLYNQNDKYLKYAYRVFSNSNGNLPAVNDINDNDIYNVIKYYVSYKTWMSAETSKIEVKDKIDATKVNFGLMLRPETRLTIEKHITGLKITPTGTGVQPIVDATKGIDEEKAKGVTNGLAIIESTRADRGFWKVETDIEELMQGAKLEVEYTYVIKNDSQEEYLSKDLVTAYESNPKGYDDTLRTISATVKNDIKALGAHRVTGTALGTYYYTGEYNESTDAKVPSIVESLEEALNNQLAFKSSSDFTAETLTDTNNYNYYNQEGTKDSITIKTLVKTNSDSGKLNKGDINPSKKLRLETTLSSSNNGEIGANIPSYIAEITKYSNAAGRENIAVPENLSYVHSEATEITMETDNEIDEFWGETIIISKPTGEDKNTAMLITIIVISGVAVIGVGIILIKKIVIKK